MGLAVLLELSNVYILGERTKKGTNGLDVRTQRRGGLSNSWIET